MKDKGGRRMKKRAKINLRKRNQSEANEVQGNMQIRRNKRVGGRRDREGKGRE